MNNRAWMAAAIASLLGLTALIYLMGGIAGAYFAEDDFQWLAGGRALLDFGTFPKPLGDGFYRPIIHIWFAGAAAVCGPRTSCYHAASLSVHLLNVALVFGLLCALAGDIRVGFLGGLLFAVEPSYTEAVVWVSAITEVLSAFCYLSSLLVQAMSWRASTRSRRLLEGLSVVLFLFALLSHESAVTLPVIAWLMWRFFGPADLTSRRGLFAGLLGCIAAFGLITFVANHNNPLIVNSTYRLGPHMLWHALDYLVGMYVGPRGALPYAACALMLVVLAAVNRLTRFGALWMVLTLAPFLGFTWGNVSRYADRLKAGATRTSEGVTRVDGVALGTMSPTDVASILQWEYQDYRLLVVVD